MSKSNTKKCSLNGCPRPHLARGYCSMHYRRWSIYGDPGPVEPLYLYGITECLVKGCPGDVVSKGYCVMHYCRWKRTGDPGPVGPLAASGIYIKNGYRYIDVGLGSRKARPEHHLVMELMIERPLTSEETVHHLNGIRDDNRPENLELWASRHPKGQRISDLITFAHEILDRYEGTSADPRTQTEPSDLRDMG